jgi:hypothetical protein
VHKRIISAVKRAEFVSDGMSCIILRGCWCHIIILNVRAQTDNKTDDVKDNFYEELEHVFDKFPKYHMKILLGDFIAKVDREDIFKPTVGNVSLCETSNGNGVSTFPHLNISQSKVQCSHIATFINMFRCFLMGKSTIRLIVCCVLGEGIEVYLMSDCDTDQCLVVAKVKERLVVNKQRSHRIHKEMVMA